MNKSGQKLNFLDCSAILFNCVVGSGLFYLGSLVLINTGMSEGWAMICWILGGGISILGAFTQAELGTAITEPGGAPVWLNRAIHPFLGYSNNILSIFISSPAAVASFALSFCTAYKTQFGLSDWGVKIMAITLTLFVCAINLLDAKTGALFARWTTVLKMIPILFILVGGLFLGGVKPDLSLVVREATGNNLLVMIALGTNASLWAYSGWNMVIPLSAEMENPAQDIPKSIITSLLGVTALYTAFNFAIYRVLPISEISDMMAQGDLYIGTAAATHIFPFGGILVTACIMVSVFGTFTSSVMSAARSQAVIARSGRFPKSFGKTTKSGVPLGPIVAQASIGILFILFSGLQGLAALSTFVSNLTAVLVILAVPILRKKEPELPRPFRVPLFWFTIPVYTLISVALLVSAVIADPSTIMLTCVGVAISAVLWFVFRNQEAPASNAHAQRDSA